MCCLLLLHASQFFFFFFFNDTATTEIYTLSLHDALPILLTHGRFDEMVAEEKKAVELDPLSSLYNIDLGWWLTYTRRWEDRKSTRLNSSHSQISYAVFCLKKKRD